jgi:hypothetical protein
MTHNVFASTGIEALDRCIDLQLDILRNPERFEGAAGQLQGIRTALAAIDRDRYKQTIHDLAELIAERDR